MLLEDVVHREREVYKYCEHTITNFKLETLQSYACFVVKYIALVYFKNIYNQPTHLKKEKNIVNQYLNEYPVSMCYMKHKGVIE